MKPRKTCPARNGLRDSGSAGPLRFRRRPMSTSLLWNLSMFELPGVIEDGMPGRNVQRKPGPARGSPRRSRTAKAFYAGGEVAMCLRAGRMGPTKCDGPGHQNLYLSEGPWGGGLPTLQGGALSSPQAPLRAVPSMRPRGRRADANRTRADEAERERQRAEAAITPRLEDLPQPP